MPERGFKRVGIAISHANGRGVRSEYGIWRRTEVYGQPVDPPTLHVQFEGTQWQEPDGTTTKQGLPSGPYTNSSCWWRQLFEEFIPARYEIVRFFSDDDHRPADNASA
jgi:hypothetical protein